MRSDFAFTPTPTQIDAIHALEDALPIKRGALLKILMHATDWYSVIHTHRFVNLVAGMLLAPRMSPERKDFWDFDVRTKLDLLRTLAIISDGEKQRLVALDGFARMLQKIDGEFEFHLYFQHQHVREEFAKTYASAWSPRSSTGSMRVSPFSSGDHAVGKPRFTLMLLVADLLMKMPDESLRTAATDAVEALLPPSLKTRPN